MPAAVSPAAWSGPLEGCITAAESHLSTHIFPPVVLDTDIRVLNGDATEPGSRLRYM